MKCDHITTKKYFFLQKKVLFFSKKKYFYLQKKVLFFGKKKYFFLAKKSTSRHVPSHSSQIAQVSGLYFIHSADFLIGTRNMQVKCISAVSVFFVSEMYMNLHA